ncbi:HAMP domain-containing sensor histidine kinase [Actinoplanes sp. NPDC051633]|uniref:sensor histidine kinase n=1 Tax=Actinoplanes sp. NPDC051633 TaxID=3155670 RepID=UPI0034424848
MSVLERLRGLPGQLALWVTLFSAVGYVVCGAFLIRGDTARREIEMDGDLRRVTSSIQRLVREDDDGVLIVTAANDDEFNTGCPEFTIVPGPNDKFAAYVSRGQCVDVDPGMLTAYVYQAVGNGRTQSGYVRDTGDRQVRIFVEPFRHTNGQYAGAVVALMNPAAQLAAHRWATLLVIGGGVLLVVLVGGASYLLASRAIGPAAGALEQQESLLADTAHDLRTPVAALRALAEAALANPAQRTELLPRTVELARRMGTIIDGVLMRARLAAGVDPLKLEPVWLDQLVTTVVEETPAEDARITVTTAPTKVSADPALMQRAIGNLIDNAMRHGRIEGRPAVVQVTVAGGRVIVADQGPGIDPSVAKEQFDRFASSGGSSGLGLAIVRWVAQAHGGTLRVYNADGGGAIFEMALPAIEN